MMMLQPQLFLNSTLNSFKSISMSESFEWIVPEPGWKTKQGIIQFDTMTDVELSRLYKYVCRQELVYMNKSYVFECKRREMETEFENRGQEVPEPQSEYHKNGSNN